jgi:hypothetical protein
MIIRPPASLRPERSTPPCFRPVSLLTCADVHCSSICLFDRAPIERTRRGPSVPSVCPLHSDPSSIPGSTLKSVRPFVHPFTHPQSIRLPILSPSVYPSSVHPEATPWAGIPVMATIRMIRSPSGRPSVPKLTTSPLFSFVGRHTTPETLAGPAWPTLAEMLWSAPHRHAPALPLPHP